MSSHSTSISPETLAHHGEFVRALARQLLADEHAADDVAQEAWLRYAERPPRSALDPRGWFAIVVRNLAHNERRAQRVRGEHEARAAKAEATPPLDDDLAQASALCSVVDAVLALDEPYRSTVLARYFRGCEPSRIASEANVPLATVKSRLQRAHAQLRERLDREHGSRANWAVALGHLAGLEGAATGAIGGLSLAKIAAIAAVFVVASVIAWRQLATSKDALPSTVASAASASVDTDSLTQVETLSHERRELDALPPTTVAPTFRVAGNVRDLAYEPLELAGGLARDVEVHLRLVTQLGFGDLLATTKVTTDTNGAFTGELANPVQRPCYLLATTAPTDERRGAYAEMQIDPGVDARAAVELVRAAHGLLDGVVVDSVGAPVPNARLSVRSGFNGAMVYELVSDARGELRDAYRGEVQSVQALDRGSVVRHFDPPPLLDSGGASGLRVVLARSASIVVRVVDAQERGIEGIDVAIALDESELRLHAAAVWPPHWTLQGRTDADGSAQIKDVCADCKLVVRVQSVSEQHDTASVRGDELAFGKVLGTPIVLAPGEQRELVARWIGELKLVGTTRSTNGDSIANANIEIARESRRTSEYVPPLARLRSGADGTFEVHLRAKDLTQPLRIVAAEKRSKAFALEGLGYVNSPGPTDGAVGVLVLDPSTAVDGVLSADVVLEPTLTIAGRLLDADGQPISQTGLGGHRLWTVPSSASSHRDASQGLGRPSVKTEPDGSFVFFGLTRGSWDLYVSREIRSFYTWESFVHAFPAVSAGAQGVELRLARVGEVRIRVRLHGGEPNELTVLHGALFPRDRERAKEPASREMRVSGVTGWPVGATLGFNGISGDVDELGTWAHGFYSTDEVVEHALQPMGPGWYVVGIVPSRRDGSQSWFTQASELRWYEPGEYVIDFELVPTTELAGRVLGDARAEHLGVELCTLDGARIPLERLPGFARPTYVVETDARGRFVVRNAPVGTFLLRAGAVDELERGEFRRELQVELAQSGNAPVDVTLR